MANAPTQIEEPMTPVSVSDTPLYQQGRLDALNEIREALATGLGASIQGLNAYYLEDDHTGMSGEDAVSDVANVVETIGDIEGLIDRETGYCRDRLRKAGVLAPLGAIEGSIVEVIE